MGGPTSQTFGYDDLYRLTSAQGHLQFQPQQDPELYPGHDLRRHPQHRQQNQADSITNAGGSAITQKATTYDWAYLYGSTHPHAPTHIGSRSFAYD